MALVAASTLDDVAARAAKARADGAPLVFAELNAGDGLRELLGELDGVVDGVRLHVAEPETELAAIVEALGPRPPAGPTLRETLGLPRPAL